VQDPNYGKTYVNMPVEIDEDSLQRMADLTGGTYYRATDRPSLEKIFSEIGDLEKTRIETKTYRHYRECYTGFLIAALSAAVLATLADHTRFSKIP